MSVREVEGWEEVREQLRAIVRRRGAIRVADEIPASRSQVFRLLSGQCSPSKALFACVCRLIEDAEGEEEEWRAWRRQ